MAPVIVEPYNPQWATDFETIKSELIRALENVDVLAIEHVGSTSVPGLAAKPIIDIDIVVTRDTVPAATDALTTAEGGYVYRGELGIVDRHAFTYILEVSGRKSPKRNLYVCVAGCQSLRNHIGVRDVLGRDPGLRAEYERVKKSLAETAKDVDEYCEAKTDVLTKILKSAGMPEEEREQIAAANKR